MKNLIQKILSIFKANDNDVDNVLKYAEKKEKGMSISEKEKEEALKSAIKITKNQNPNED